VPTAWWLTEAMCWGGVPPATPLAAPAGRMARMRARVKQLPFAGKAARYLKRLILMPWNFTKLQQAVEENQREIRTLLEEKKREVQDAMKQQTRSWRTVIGTQLMDLRSEVVRQQMPPETGIRPAQPRDRSAAA
jgi:hypothetical protein